MYSMILGTLDLEIFVALIGIGILGNNFVESSQPEIVFWAWFQFVWGPINGWPLLLASGDECGNTGGG
jgi:hypothetical protein